MATHTQTVQDIYANFGRGNVAAIVDTFADDIRFRHAGAPEVRGHGHHQHCPDGRLVPAVVLNDDVGAAVPGLRAHRLTFIHPEDFTLTRHPSHPP